MKLLDIISEQISVRVSPSDNEKAEYSITHTGAEGDSKQKSKSAWTNCMGISRKTFWKLKKRGRDVKFVEGKYLQNHTLGGKVHTNWIDHAWNLIDGIPVDLTYGKNDGQYKGYVIKDEYMEMIPDWADPDKMDYKDSFAISVLKSNLVPVNKTISEQQTPALTVPEQTLLGFLARFLKGEKGEFQNTPIEQLKKTLLFNSKTIYPMAQKLIEKKNTGKKTYDDKTFNALLTAMDKTVDKDLRYELYVEGGKLNNITYNAEY
jgi:hypothetical protein